MGFDIASAGYDTGAGLLGAGLGIIMQKANDKRQLKQQAKLQALQIGGQKDMTDYNMMKQMEMWKNTSYPAQMEMMKKAGINPGLMYGMGGGGGQTAGSASGSVTGGVAPSGGGEIPMGIEKVMELKLLQAQKENIEADTANKRGDAANKPLTGENIKQDTLGKEIQNRIAKLDEWIKGKSKQDQVDIIMWQGQKILEEVDQLARENVTDKATQNDRIDTVKAELAAKALMPALIEAQTKTERGKPSLQQAEIAKMQADVQNEIQNRMQRWEALYQQGVNIGEGRLRALMAQDAEELKVPLDLLEMVAQGIIFKKLMTPTTVPTKEVGGFHKR